MPALGIRSGRFRSTVPRPVRASRMPDWSGGPKVRLFRSAVRRPSSCHTDRTGSSQYQRNEKPCHTDRLRPIYEFDRAPLFIIHGTNDGTIPAQSSIRNF